MRKKIKEIMNKEEGFTLVELLAVIVILGIILAIAVPGIGRVINKAQDNADVAEQELVVDAARLYFTAEGEDDGEVPVSDLIKEGYLDTSSKELSKDPTGSVTKATDSAGKVTYTHSEAEGTGTGGEGPE